MDNLNIASIMAALNGDLPNAMVAATPGGIEAQEAQGQRDLCNTSRLPKDHSSDDRKALESAGVVFGDSVDSLFLEVTLPDGWKLQPTEHSMWSDLLDENGFKRAAVFYKAAYYDMSAHFNACRRFSVSAYHDPHDDGSRSIVVIDAKQDTLAKDFGRAERGYKAAESLELEAINWLDENYPDHKNSSAYWSD